jgi:hypothetical protein
MQRLFIAAGLTACMAIWPANAGGGPGYTSSCAGASVAFCAAAAGLSPSSKLQLASGDVVPSGTVLADLSEWYGAGYGIDEQLALAEVGHSRFVVDRRSRRIVSAVP